MLTQQSNLGVQHFVMRAPRGSGESSFAPVSLLICFCAAWPGWGKVSPPKAGPSTGRQRGKKKRSISSLCFQAQIAEERSSPSPSPHHSSHSESVHVAFLVGRSAFMSSAFHLLIAKNGTGFQRHGSHYRRSLFNSIQQRLV